MACTDPKKAWEYGLTENGKQKMVFSRPEGVDWDPILLPCGKCVSCKLSYSREWATRITHEAQTSKLSCFLTLTYDEENLPDPPSVSKKEVQDFIKNLRQYLRRNVDDNIRFKYFACGEYGSTRGQRPHYHIIILGWDFTDKRYWSKTDTGNINYRSPTLEKLWKKGFSTIGEVTYQSAGYVARYTFKKQKDKREYTLVDTGSGEIVDLEPEFLCMSQGIGKDWYNKFKFDTEKDYLNVNFQKNKVPRYYDKQLEKEDPEKLEKIKDERRRKAEEIAAKEGKSHRRMKNIVKTKQKSMLIRGLEND